MLKSLEFPTRAAVLAALAGFILSFVTTSGEGTILFISERGSGEISVAGMLSFLAMGLGVIVTALSFRQQQPVDTDVRRGPTRLIARIVTSLAAGIIVFTITAVGLFVVNALFQGLTLDRLFVLGTVTIYAGLVSFALATWASSLDNINLLVLAGAVAVTGIVLAALAVGDPQWWQRSLSYLGSTETAGVYFNIALILTGLLVLVVNQETIVVLRGLVDKGDVDRDYFFWVRIHLIAIPICITGVGLFPTRITPLSDTLHNLSSHLMVVFFLFLMLSTVNREDSFHPRSFRRISRFFAWSILIFMALDKMQVVNFVAFELIILVPIGAWLALYQQQVNSLATTGRPADVQLPKADTPVEIYALNVGIVTATIGAILSMLYVSDATDMIPFVAEEREGTIGNLWVIMGAALGAGVTAFAYRRFLVDRPGLSDAERTALQSGGFWPARIVITLTAGIVVFVLAILLVLGIDLLFPGVAFTVWGVIGMTAGFAGVIGAAVAYWTSTLGSVNLLVLSGITAFLGIGAAALFMGDPEWWRVSLSYLGSMASPVAIFFNLGLILTGMIVLAVNQDSIALLRVLRDEGRISGDYFMNARWFLVLIPVMLAAVGLFPRRYSPLYDLIHNLSASAMGLAFMVLAFFVIGRRYTFHKRTFIQQSRALVLVVVALYVIYILGVVNYVGFELLLFLPIGIWLLLYQFELRAYARGERSDMEPDTNTGGLSPA